MDNFDLKKYLIENKVTTNSRMVTESAFKTAKEYIRAVAKDSHNVDLDSPDAEQKIKDLDINPVDIMWWMQDNDPEVGGINEEELYDYVEENDLDIKDVAEYQFREQSYDFSIGGGAGEFESTIKVQMVVDEKGKPVKIEGYDFIVSTDRGTLTGEYVLMNLKHVKFLKSIADIFNVDAGWYAGYKDRTKN